MLQLAKDLCTWSAVILAPKLNTQWRLWCWRSQWWWLWWDDQPTTSKYYCRQTNSNIMQNTQQTDHYSFWHSADLLNEVNCWLEIKAEVNELPINALAAVLILLQDEHRMIEQLLKLFICVVDAQLFKRVELQHVQSHQWFNSHHSLIIKVQIYQSKDCFSVGWILF